MSGQEWRLRAACRDADPDAPFEREGTPELELFVRQFCRPCPVKEDCLAFALERDDDGIYGGLTRRQRNVHKGTSGIKLAPCGTWAAYQRHIRWGEVPDEACSRACARESRVSVAKKLAKEPAA